MNRNWQIVLGSFGLTFTVATLCLLISINLAYKSKKISSIPIPRKSKGFEGLGQMGRKKREEGPLEVTVTTGSNEGNCIEQGIDYYGCDIHLLEGGKVESVDAKDCQRKCQNHTLCKYFTYAPHTQGGTPISLKCHLKTCFDNYTTLKDAWSGPRTCNVTEKACILVTGKAAADCTCAGNYSKVNMPVPWARSYSRFKNDQDDPTGMERWIYRRNATNAWCFGNNTHCFHTSQDSFSSEPVIEGKNIWKEYEEKGFLVEKAPWSWSAASAASGAEGCTSGQNFITNAENPNTCTTWLRSIVIPISIEPTTGSTSGNQSGGTKVTANPNQTLLSRTTSHASINTSPKEEESDEGCYCYPTGKLSAAKDLSPSKWIIITLAPMLGRSK